MLGLFKKRTARKVERGIKLIEEKVPGGLARVDIESLEMWNPCKCVASQATGIRFNPAIEILGIGWLRSTHYGLHAFSDEQYFLLQEIWGEKLRSRYESA